MDGRGRSAFVGGVCGILGGGEGGQGVGQVGGIGDWPSPRRKRGRWGMGSLGSHAPLPRRSDPRVTSGAPQVQCAVSIDPDAVCCMVMKPPLLQRLAAGNWRLAVGGGWWRLVAVGGSPPWPHTPNFVEMDIASRPHPRGDRPSPHSSGHSIGHVPNAFPGTMRPINVWRPLWCTCA